MKRPQREMWVRISKSLDVSRVLNSQNDLVTPAELIEIIGSDVICYQTPLRLMNRGELKRYTRKDGGKRYYISLSEFAQLVEAKLSSE